MRSIALLLALLLGSSAHAAIISVTGTNHIAPVANVQKDNLVGDPPSVFQEKLNFATTAAVTMDVITDTVSHASDPGNSPLTIGTAIDSYYLHYDFVTTALNTASGTIMFDTDIIGIIGNRVNLLNSHGELGASGTTYWNGVDHGIWDSQADLITIDASRRTLRYTLSVGTAIDSLRIITEATTVPEPATAALLTLGLLGAVSRKRKA